jgi:hypothetical protein
MRRLQGEEVIIAILIWIGVINTAGLMLGLYGYGMAKGWWK